MLRSPYLEELRHYYDLQFRPTLTRCRALSWSIRRTNFYVAISRISRPEKIVAFDGINLGALSADLDVEGLEQKEGNIAGHNRTD